MGRLSAALVTANGIWIDGRSATAGEQLELYWAAQRVESIWRDGVCVNCGAAKVNHYGFGGVECMSGAVLVDMESGVELGRAAGDPGVFTPRGLL